MTLDQHPVETTERLGPTAARSITSVDSGSGSATTGTAESTATVVSLPPRTRSSHARAEALTGSRPHDAWGNPSPNAGLEPAGYSSR